MTPSARAVRMDECVGLWRRTLLVDTDGSTDTSTDVRWLQGLTAYVDLRRPRPLVHSGKQDGFAGWLAQDGDVFCWTRFVGLQPPGPHPDAGHVRWAGVALIEVGVHADYVEEWRLEPVPAHSCWALTLRDDDGRTALLLRVGTHFGWARDAAAGPEIAMGHAGSDGWVVTAASEAAREGDAVEVHLRGNEVHVVNVDQSTETQRFSIITSEGTVQL